MARVKHIIRRNGIRAALCAVLAAYIRLVHGTSRWRVEGGDIPQRLWDRGAPFILAFWHGRLLLMPYCWRSGVPIRMLISQHPDGQFISQTVRHFGIDTIVGSSSRGGGTALRAILKTLRSGLCVGLTPDGPRGPRMRASAGIVQAARLTGMPILPCAVAVGRRRVLSSWDRFILALPFTRGVFVWGEPITVAPDATDDEIEAARRLLEDRLTALTDEADRQVGAAPIAPAPLEAVAPTGDREEAARAVAGRR